MQVMDQRIPPPPLDRLMNLQLMRTTLVSFLDWQNFSDVVAGCYVRVLLEMRSEDRLRDSLDNYYIACVKGAKKGPSYTGFSCDGASTEWHILIELPPCFKATQNGNVVQLNSISNSPFRQNEYQQWVSMAKEHNQQFITIAQLEFRCQMLEDSKLQASTPVPRRRWVNEDPAVTEAREARLAEFRELIKNEILGSYVALPHVDKLHQQSIESLQEIESQCLDRISAVRIAINEKTKCRVCQNHVCTVICYPCKHQVVCRSCAEDTSMTVCPAPGCGARVEQKFEPFSA
jgi:hypothetical protein